MTTKFFPTNLTGSVRGTDTVWVNNKHSKIPIIDGKISFYDRNLDACFELYVTQIKGKGTADADDLTKLSDKHIFILNTLLKRFRWQQYWTTDEILGKIHFDLEETEGRKQEARIFKPNNWRRPISELFRKGILLKSGTGNPPRYTLDLAKAETARNTGKFD